MTEGEGEDAKWTAISVADFDQHKCVFHTSFAIHVDVA